MDGERKITMNAVASVWYSTRVTPHTRCSWEHGCCLRDVTSIMRNKVGETNVSATYHKQLIWGQNLEVFGSNDWDAGGLDWLWSWKTMESSYWSRARAWWGEWHALWQISGWNGKYMHNVDIWKLNRQFFFLSWNYEGKKWLRFLKKKKKRKGKPSIFRQDFPVSENVGFLAWDSF